jgi:hypothetical protein
MRRRTQPPRPPAAPPASAKEGAAAVLKATVKLFDRQDGEGADWRLIAETLFMASFECPRPAAGRKHPRALGLIPISRSATEKKGSLTGAAREPAGKG